MKIFKKQIIALFAALTALSAFADTESDQMAIGTQDVDSTAILRQQVAELTDQLSQEEQAKKYRSIWGRNKYMLFSYGNLEAKLGGGPVEKSKFSFGMATGRTFMFPGKPIAGLFKVGLDLRMADLVIAKLKTDGIYSEGWGELPDEEGNEDDLDLGRWFGSVSVGIGPVVTVAPFSGLDNAANKLKASLYFHYKPSAGVIFVSQDGETESSWGYMNLFDFGGRISWKLISVGIEGHWGNGKFKPIEFDFDDSGLPGAESPKQRCKIASTRFYIAFTF